MDFDVDPRFQRTLEWAGAFTTEEVEPVDAVLGHPADLANSLRQALIPPLQRRVKAEGLWAPHLSRDLGGSGLTQVELAHLNEILGTSRCAPTVFGAQAPDSGNSELLALFGTPEQQDRYLRPLIAGDVVSCFSMTEPEGGADPTGLRARADRDAAGRWCLFGEKWFASNARFADFIIVVAVTDPDAEPHRRSSMFIVPRGAQGLEIVHNVASAGQPPGDGSHGYLRFHGVALDDDQLLGEPGAAFAMAQARLGGGRLQHAMRTVGAARRALEMMCQRAVSRTTKGSRLADLQLVQSAIADSWVELEQFRLLVLHAAWRIDRGGDVRLARRDIAAVKVAMPRVLHDIAARALNIHGSIGVSDEMPFMRLVAESFQMGIADGPTDVHKVSLARNLLRDHEPSTSAFPDYHLPTARGRAHQKFASILADRPEEQPWT